MDKLNQFKGTILEDGYGIIGKKVMKDKRLHVIAKALYSYLCTYGNSGYPSRDLITNDLGIGKDTYTKYISELKENGYIRVEQVKQNGKFKHNVYYVEQIPCIVCSDTVSSDTVSSDTVKPYINSTNINNTILNNTINTTLMFDEFWKAYPKKKAPADAERAWKKIKVTEELLDKMLLAIKKQKLTNDWIKENGQYIPHPATWLNGQRWEDEVSLSSGFKQSNAVGIGLPFLGGD